MESKKETTRYVLYADSEYCAYTLYLNGLKIKSNNKVTPVSTGFTIGEYLKPKNNVLKLDVWDPNSKPGKWREGAKCGIYIEGADPVKKLGPDSVTEVNFYPSVQPDLNDAEKLFIKTSAIETTVGKSPNLPQISYSSETGHYTITREFDTREGYIEWPWYTSPPLTNPLPPEQLKRLQEAYLRVWQVLSNKDLSAMRKSFHEMMYERAMAANSTEERYFDSADFDELFEDEFLKEFILMPLDFGNKELKLALDQKVISFEPTPLLFCPKNKMGENFDINECDKLNPRFCFDGKEFVISR